MEVGRCSRCGAFYTSGGYVCPKCTSRDNFELSQFKQFIEKNSQEINSLNQVSYQTGISEKNINRFLGYDGFKGYKKLFKF